MNIREATIKDRPHAIRLWQACGLVRPWNDPEKDFDILDSASGGTLLVGEDNGIMIATTMVGFDGHRGWVYYVAVRPDLRGHGHGATIMAAAEEWLRARGCPKIALMVREDNTESQSFYYKQGYMREHRALMAKFLTPPPAQSPDHMPPRVFDVTVSYLEMHERPNRRPVQPPKRQGERLALQRAIEPTVGFYRFLHQGVGDPWLWYERRKMSDAALMRTIHDPKVEIYVPWLNGVPAGFIELDFRDPDFRDPESHAMPNVAEVAYFGLLPEFIGRGLGPYLLDWAIDCAWNREPAPTKLKVNTCTLDHPKALRGYQKAGFEILRREQIKVTDPVAMGITPKETKVLTPGY